MSLEKQHIGLKAVRPTLALALFFMMIGTAMELFLLDHYEDVQQLIPLLCITASVVMVVLLFFVQTNIIRGLFKLVLLLTALSGIYGTYLHLLANYEFEQEMKPTAAAWHLFTESLSGALPSLAPASMIVLALIGYSYYLLIIRQQ